MEETFNSIQKLVGNLTGINIDELKPESTFAELGLNSLIMVELVFNLKDLHQVELSIHDMFSNPTLGGLAEAILKAND